MKNSAILISPDTVAILRQLRAKKELETGSRAKLGEIANEVISNYGKMVIVNIPTPAKDIKC